MDSEKHREARKKYLDSLSPEEREEIEKTKREGEAESKKRWEELKEVFKPIHKLYEDNLHHIKARDILKDAIQVAIDNPSMTLEVKETGELFILLLEETGNSFKYDPDAVMEPIKKIVEKDTNSQSGRHAANAKHAKTNDLKVDIKNIWASGKYTSREICADEEWKTLGFGSRKTAREALTNTPDPSPWPARKIKK